MTINDQKWMATEWVRQGEFEAMDGSPPSGKASTGCAEGRAAGAAL